MLLSSATSLISSKEATYPGRMLITFWCDSDITFLRGLYLKKCDSTVFLCNVLWLLNLCGAGGDASFAPGPLVYLLTTNAT